MRKYFDNLAKVSVLTAPSRFETIGPSLAVLPDFLAETKYAEITDNTVTTMNPSIRSCQDLFGFLNNQPKLLEYFQRFMAVQRNGAVSWLSVFPFTELLGDFRGEKVFVDIGGGFGHQCIAIKEAFPDLAGKIELQDLPQTILHNPSIDGVKVVEHNFFEPQVTKGTVKPPGKNIELGTS
jgi:demethylsterigmatocystin 6-O-methyltransferase